jgi:hypothetical protein
MHAEAPIRGGRVDNDQDVAAIFSYLKDLDANFVRLCHYPHDERMERTADRDGIMIWSEIPNWQRISFDKPEVYAKAVLTMLREMIRRDRNKASVILWSVSNETGNNPTRTKFLTDLVAEARRLDATRLITSALNTGPSTATRGCRTTLCAMCSTSSDRTSTSAGTTGDSGTGRQHSLDLSREACHHERIRRRSQGRQPRRQSTSAGPKSSRSSSTSTSSHAQQNSAAPRHHSMDPDGFPLAWPQHSPNSRTATTAKASSPKRAKRSRPSRSSKRPTRNTPSANPNSSPKIGERQVSTLRPGSEQASTAPPPP